MNNPRIDSTTFWDTRYSASEFAYGEAPNQFYKDHLHLIPPRGKILFPAEGEGRNMVYAATQEYEVTAFDYSTQGRTKAQQLAKKYGVSIDYRIGGLEDMMFEPQSFDGIVLVFAHFFSDIRNQYHQKLATLLKPGGLIILEGFSVNHLIYSALNPKSGGPKNRQMLFSKDLLKQDFKSLSCLSISEEIIQLNEGIYHQGDASVIRYIGKKTET